MPKDSGRNGNAGNRAGMSFTGRTGTPGNVDGAKHRVSGRSSADTMTQSATGVGRSLIPGNTSRFLQPSNAAGSMQGGTGTAPKGGVPGKSGGKFNYQKSQGLLKRHG